MKVDAGIVCHRCGRADVEFEVVSAHRTSQGVVRYVRCACGALQVLSRSQLDSSERVLIGGQAVPAAEPAA